MQNLGMQYYWENLKERYSRKQMTVEILKRVMARNIKMYGLIDHIMKLYDLIKKIEVRNLIHFVSIIF